MGPPGEGQQPLPRLSLIARLPQRPSLQEHIGIHPQRDVPLPRAGEHQPGVGLPPRVLHHKLLGGDAVSHLVHVGHDRFVGNPQRAQHLPSAGRRRGEDQTPSGNQISISRAADSSESEPWTMLKVTSSAKSPRIEPMAASTGFVDPIT